MLMHEDLKARISIEDLAGNRDLWFMLAELIRSDQIDASRQAALAHAYPEFWTWLEASK